MIIFGETINMWFAFLCFIVGGYIGYQMGLTEVAVREEEKQAEMEECNNKK